MGPIDHAWQGNPWFYVAQCMATRTNISRLSVSVRLFSPFDREGATWSDRVPVRHWLPKKEQAMETPRSGAAVSPTLEYPH